MSWITFFMPRLAEKAPATAVAVGLLVALATLILITSIVGFLWLGYTRPPIADLRAHGLTLERCRHLHTVSVLTSLLLFVLDLAGGAAWPWAAQGDPVQWELAKVGLSGFFAPLWLTALTVEGTLNMLVDRHQEHKDSCG